MNTIKVDHQIFIQTQSSKSKFDDLESLLDEIDDVERSNEESEDLSSTFDLLSLKIQSNSIRSLEFETSFVFIF